MAMKMPEDMFISNVRIGEKGQIVIPKEVRDMFGISPGDLLMLMADKKRGIAIVDNAKFISFFRDLSGSNEEENGNE